jgi:small-conductance mechanosensitive channel
LLGGRTDLGAEARFPRQLVLLAMTVAGLVLVLLLLPMAEGTRQQVLSLLGIVLTAVIALSSTTFVANAMAGLMLRVVQSFHPGDFIRIGAQFGRVTERGLFHTEIQTEDRDLSTLPNLYLVTNPVTVVRSSGTIISATLSLGYDLSREQVEALLKQAGEQAGLEDTFVQVMELGDFAVSYRVAGVLLEVTQLLTARSNLRKQVLDVLHDNSIEIVSPGFMNQRRIADDVRFIPARTKKVPDQGVPVEAQSSPETLIFDKAEEASALEKQRDEYKRLIQQLEDLKQLRKATDESGATTIEAEMSALAERVKKLGQEIVSREKNVKAD